MKVKIIGLALSIGVVFFAIVCCMVLLFSCNTEKKLTAKAETFTTKFPKKALPYFRDKFPCIETSADTTIFTTDTTIYVDCPDTVKAAEYFTIHDTVKIYGKTIIRDGKTIKVPVTLPQKIVTVTKTVEDSSKVKELIYHLQDVVKEREKYKDKNNHKGRVIIWLIVAVAGLLVPYIIKAIKFFKL